MWSKSVLLIGLLATVAGAQATLTVIHPTEGQSLPALKDVFVFGEVTPGSTLTINGTMIKVHPKGGYLAMVPVSSGPVLLTCEATTSTGENIKLERHFTIAGISPEPPRKPLTLIKETIEPSEDLVLAPGDPLRVSFQGSSQEGGEFSVEGVVRHVRVAERLGVSNSTEAARGLYEGNYIIQPGDKAERIPVDVTFKGQGKIIQAKSRGRLTIDSGAVPRTGLVTEDVAAVRTGPEGGYDLFLYKGMRVRLTGKVKNQRRVRLSSLQSGWVKESAIQELPAGTPSPRSYLNNIIIAHQEDSTLIRIPLDDLLPYRTEQMMDPFQLVVTLHGAVDKTDLIRYDPADTLIRQVRWKQISPDTCQIIIEPTFKVWWGYDVRYEGTTLVVEVRKPWTRPNVKGMTIALDPGHGGPELGATGPHGTFEKDANLAIARVVRSLLENAGARVMMTRDSDMDVPLYERSRIAWRNRAHLFVSIHCNAAGEWENPVLNNGYSTYWYHPQSLALAQAVHKQYGARVALPDRGLFYSDFAVNRMIQMPAILTEQAYIIVPEQEQLIFSPVFQRKVAQSILNGIQSFIHPE
jgi:N-acetylmuramoyl-L-alanine amidase